MLNKDYKEMLQSLADEQVKFLLMGAYALADAEALEALKHSEPSAAPLPCDPQTDISDGVR